MWPFPGTEHMCKSSRSTCMSRRCPQRSHGRRSRPRFALARHASGDKRHRLGVRCVTDTRARMRYGERRRTKTKPPRRIPKRLLKNFGPIHPVRVARQKSSAIRDSAGPYRGAMLTFVRKVAHGSSAGAISFWIPSNEPIASSTDLPDVTDFRTRRRPRSGA